MYILYFLFDSHSQVILVKLFLWCIFLSAQLVLRVDMVRTAPTPAAVRTEPRVGSLTATASVSLVTWEQPAQRVS